MINIKTYPSTSIIDEAIVYLDDVLALTPAERLQLAKDHPYYYVPDVMIVDDGDFDEGMYLKFLFNKRGELKRYYKRKSNDEGGSK